jgi:predicted RNase H-like nuclease (RuvC/YqgF family)
MLRKMILELRYERSLCRCVELRREIEGYRKDVKDFRSQIEEMREVYEGRVREQEEEINRLRLEIMEKDEEIGRLLKNIEEGSTGRDTGRGPGRSVGETDRRSNEQPGN